MSIVTRNGLWGLSISLATIIGMVAISVRVCSLCYEVGRDPSEGLAIDQRWAIVIVFLFLVGGTAGIGLLINARLESRSLVRPILAVTVLSICAAIISCRAGAHQYDLEFDKNRHLANGLVKAIKDFRTANRRLPKTLAELELASIPKLYRSGNQHFFDYEGGFLSYTYGWYSYHYDFEKDRWETRD